MTTFKCLEDLEGVEDIEGGVWVDKWPEQAILDTSGIKILIMLEPRATFAWLYTLVEQEGQKLDLILTFDEGILAKFPNARLLYFGTTWVSQAVAEGPPPVKAGQAGAQISFLCGDKLVTEGHRIRRAVYTRNGGLEAATGKKMLFYRSSHGTPLPQVSRRGNPVYRAKAKDELHAPFQYSIVIENSNVNHYFSEKLLDALLCRTIPIYWGAPSVLELFDPRGIVYLKGGKDDVLRQLEELLPSCGAARYAAAAEAIEENWRRAMLYAYNYTDRIAAALSAWLEEKGLRAQPQ